MGDSDRALTFRNINHITVCWVLVLGLLVWGSRFEVWRLGFGVWGFSVCDNGLGLRGRGLLVLFHTVWSRQYDATGSHCNRFSANLSIFGVKTISHSEWGRALLCTSLSPVRFALSRTSDPRRESWTVTRQHQTLKPNPYPHDLLGTP